MSGITYRLEHVGALVEVDHGEEDVVRVGLGVAVRRGRDHVLIVGLPANKSGVSVNTVGDCPSAGV